MHSGQPLIILPIQPGCQNHPSIIPAYTMMLSATACRSVLVVCISLSEDAEAFGASFCIMLKV